MSLTWTSNGKVWLALHGDQWAKIQRVVASQHPYHVTVGRFVTDDGVAEIDTAFWSVDGKFSRLKHAQAWAAEKLGVNYEPN